MNEFELIAALMRIFDQASDKDRGGVLVVPNGDDAAVIRAPSGLTTLTTDALVEDVHFSFRICSREDVGFRAVAVNLSDLAAMGATPLGLLVSLVLPDGMPDDAVISVGRGIGQALAAFDVPVVGGNITRTSGPLVISITAIGDQGMAAPLRSGAEPGDGVWVSGNPGDAALGLKLLLEKPEMGSLFPALVRAYRRPTPRLDLVPVLGATCVHAAIDISDGLVADIAHIAADSGVGALIVPADIPVGADAERFCRSDTNAWMDSALYGGDDYQLAVVAPASSGAALDAAGLVRIGSITEGSGVMLSIGGKEFPPRTRAGWQHR